VIALDRMLSFWAVTELDEAGSALALGMRNFTPQPGQVATDPALASSDFMTFRHLGHLKAIMGCLSRVSGE
jgi:hypothetical protein